MMDGERVFYCLAVNLLELADLTNILAQIKDGLKPDTLQKEQIATIVGLIQTTAEKHGITLKLRKKTKTS